MEKIFESFSLLVYGVPLCSPTLLLAGYWTLSRQSPSFYGVALMSECSALNVARLLHHTEGRTDSISCRILQAVILHAFRTAALHYSSHSLSAAVATLGLQSVKSHQSKISHFHPLHINLLKSWLVSGFHILLVVCFTLQPNQPILVSVVSLSMLPSSITFDSTAMMKYLCHKVDHVIQD